MRKPKNGAPSAPLEGKWLIDWVMAGARLKKNRAPIVHHWRKSCTSLLFSKCGRLFKKYARPMKKCERLFEKYARPGITVSRELNMKECLVHH